MKIHVILRTHDKTNIHGNKKRYIPISKKELIIGCISSLLNSLNLVKKYSIYLTILDDHSSEDFILNLKFLLSHFNHPYEIIHLKEHGFNHSALMQFEYCKNSNADLVYSVEDDYLHFPTSIEEMIYAYNDLKKFYNLSEVCIFPYDTPQEYDFDIFEKYLITRGRNRHWRSTTWTTQTFMTSPKVFIEYWKYFEKLAKEFKVVPKHLKNTLDWDNIIWEETTIGNIWKNHVLVFQPIPSLALHIQFEKEKDNFIDHIEWWDKYSKIKKVNLFKCNYL